MGNYKQIILFIQSEVSILNIQDLAILKFQKKQAT